MNTEIKALEVKIQKLFEDERQPNPRTVFDIGVEFGCTLRKYNIENYGYEFWSNFEKQQNLEKDIDGAVSSINKFLLRLVRKSVAEYIEEYGSWNITRNDWSYNLSKFDDETLQKYCVQITYVNMTQYGGSFECRFKATGRLEKLFEENNVDNRFTVYVNNDENEESTSLDDINEVDSKIGYISFVKRIKDWKLEKYNNFLHDISKDFLFDLLATV